MRSEKIELEALKKEHELLKIKYQRVLQRLKETTIVSGKNKKKTGYAGFLVFQVITLHAKVSRKMSNQQAQKHALIGHHTQPVPEYIDPIRIPLSH